MCCCAESPLSTPNVVDIPPDARFFENPEEGDAMAPGDASVLEVGEDASEGSRSCRSFSAAIIVFITAAILFS